MPWEPWSVPEETVNNTATTANVTAAATAATKPVLASTRVPGAPRRFCFVLGAEECGVVERAALLRQPSSAPADVGGVAGSGSSMGAMLSALTELQRVSRGVDGAVALLTAVSQAQAMLQATDGCLLVWRRPSDERPTMLRPSDLPPTAPPSRTACSVLYNHHEALALLARAARDRHVLSMWRTADETDTAIGGGGEADETGAGYFSFPRKGSFIVDGVPDGDTLERALAVPVPLPPPFGPAVLVLACATDRPGARAPLGPASAGYVSTAFTVDQENATHMLALSAASVFTHASSPPQPSPRGPAALHLPPPQPPAPQQFEVVARGLGSHAHQFRIDAPSRAAFHDGVHPSFVTPVPPVPCTSPAPMRPLVRAEARSSNGDEKAGGREARTGRGNADTPMLDVVPEVPATIGDAEGEVTLPLHGVSVSTQTEMAVVTGFAGARQVLSTTSRPHAMAAAPIEWLRGDRAFEGLSHKQLNKVCSLPHASAAGRTEQTDLTSRRARATMSNESVEIVNDRREVMSGGAEVLRIC